MHRLTFTTLAALLLALPASRAEPTGNSESESHGLFSGNFPGIHDPEDGCFDLSAILDDPRGFFPLVKPITEPAVGAGGAFIPIFIDLPKDHPGRPDIWAAGIMRTSNGSRGYFGGYSGYFADDRWHVFGGAGKFSVNLDFHGLGRLGTVDGQPLRYNLDSAGGLLGVDRRIGKSPWRIGMRYLYGEIDPSLVLPGDSLKVNNPEFVRRFNRFDFSSTISSLQAALTYDSRDNIFTPTKGLYSEVDLTANLPVLGASDEYQILAWTGIWYQPLLDDKLFFGWRADLTQSFGDVPFYRRPAISLRGAPAQRYQGAGVASTEAELRWQLHPRWSVLGFAGAGATWPGEARLGETETTLTGGAGFRYLVARRHGLHTGIDVAYGEEGAAVYIQFGSGWFRP